MDQHLYLLEIKLFFRNKAAWAGLLILFISGFAGLYFGKKFIARQQIVIEKASRLQQENTATNVKYFGKELGLLLYHNKFSIAHVPDNWAAFANGQRDLNPFLISVTMLGLEGQLHDTDLLNPSTLLLGNMDLAFVFIFLFPLVIIAFTYNLLSAEKENGIWGLLSSQTAAPLNVLWRKFSVRIISIFAAAMLLMAAALFYLQLAVNQYFLLVLVVLCLYLSFWFALSFWIISRGRSSNSNAMSLIAFWVLLNVISPALLNVWLTQTYPVPEALDALVQQREGYHEKWDMEKSVTMNSFFKHYPQLKKYPFPEDQVFSWYWYYAMQQNGDDQAAQSLNAMSKKLEQRDRFTQISAMMLPGIQAQLIFNQLAGSDLKSHLEFQMAVRKYHEKLRLYFYPAIFEEKQIDKIDWSQFKLKQYKADSMVALWQGFLSLTILTLLFSLLAISNFRKTRDFL